MQESFCLKTADFQLFTDEMLLSEERFKYI